MNKSTSGGFQWNDGVVRCLAAILLSVAVMVFPGRAANCPENAVTTGYYLTLAAYRTNGTNRVPVGSSYVQVGETICFTSAVVFVPLNFVDYSPSAAFSGGTMTIAGSDVTPPGGVPLIGFPECGGSPFARSDGFERPVTLADALAGSIYVTARYTNGPSYATATVRVSVRPWVNPIAQGPKPPPGHRVAKPQKPKPQRWARWRR